jgi:glycine oxidase
MRTDDCLIVGAGVIGLSIAYELAQAGLRVRVIDRGKAGQEASWAGAGILPPANFSTVATAVHPYDQLRALSNQIHEQWADRLRTETGIDTGYRRCGGIYLARSIGEAAALAGFADDLVSHGIAAQRLSPLELAQLEPVLRPLIDQRNVLCSILLPEEAQLRNPRHLRALLRACQQLGVEVDEQVEVSQISHNKNEIECVVTSNGDRLADRYCFCSGAWTYELLRQLGVTTGILPIRGQIVLYHCSSPPFQHVLNEGSRYLVPRDDGRVLVGSTEEEAGFDKRTTPEALDELRHFACALIPSLQSAEIERSWAGLRPGTFDGFPYIGTIPGLRNGFVAAGHFRSGLQLSAGTARVMGQLIRGLRPDIDLSPFRVGRG